MAGLLLKDINKVYPGGKRAVSDVNLEIKDKEFIVIFGPSGCGKSTLLRLIAGLDDNSSGELFIDGKPMDGVAPKDRDIAMVFQTYALYPHLTVYDNMAFGLNIRKVPKPVIDQKVKAVAAMLGITEYLSRKPKSLSAVQRQRVALGRSIVREPKVFLFDEPLSGFDAKLRAAMTEEFTRLHGSLAATFVYTTSDQLEAMSLGSRIVVMKEGAVQQVDTPENLYDHPANLFVARLIGSPEMHFFEKATLAQEDGETFVNINGNQILLPQSVASKIPKEYLDTGKQVIVGVRPEDMQEGEQLAFDVNHIHLFDSQTEVNIIV